MRTEEDERLSDWTPRLYSSEAEVRRVTAGLLGHGLARADWTHEAHLAAVCVLLLEYPEIRLDDALPEIIRSYNVSVGGVNDDTQGYHETLTRFWLGMARCFLEMHTAGTVLDRINAFIASDEGRRDAPYSYYSHDLLFSAEARRVFVAPDIG